MRQSLSPSIGSSSAVSRNSASKMVQHSDAVAILAFKKVNKYQRGQILTLALAFIFSTATCLTLSYVYYIFGQDCLLFSTWVGTINTNEALPLKKYLSFNKNVSVTPATDRITSTTISHVNFDDLERGFLEGYAQNVDLKPAKIKDEDNVLYLNSEKTKWGKKKPCYLTQFGYASAAAGGFILCWFFVFFRPTKESYLFKKQTAASKLIIPGILFCLAFTVCVIVAAITLAMGVSSWCGHVSGIQIPKAGATINSCSELQSYGISKDGQISYSNYYSILIISEVFAWLGAICWLSSLVILSVRCYKHVDFPDYYFEHSNLNNDGFNVEANDEEADAADNERD